MKHSSKNLQRLLVFVEVVDTGSFTAAADKLHLGKSVISQHISELESALKIKLLNRTTRSIGLTEAGETIYQKIKQIINIIDEIEEEASGHLLPRHK